MQGVARAREVLQHMAACCALRVCHSASWFGAAVTEVSRCALKCPCKPDRIATGPLCHVPYCSAWADHFDSIGADYVFWSAKAGMDEHSAGKNSIQQTDQFIGRDGGP